VSTVVVYKLASIYLLFGFRTVNLVVGCFRIGLGSCILDYFRF